MPLPTQLRLLFTADLHIGRTLHGKSLLDDQRHILNELASLARDQRASHLVIGGDLFDRSIPSADAVALADWFFQECVTALGMEVIVIAGNHDSPERLDFAAGLLSRQGLHIVGSFPADIAPLILGKGEGAVELYALPYAEPATIHHLADQAGNLQQANHDLGNHQAAWERIMAGLRAEWAQRPRRRRILVGHLLVAGGVESESERPLSIGGAQAVAPSCLAGFDLALLGHLHRSQECWPGVWYAGSPLCYSASEVGQEKSALLVEIRGQPAPDKRKADRTKAIEDLGPDLFGDLAVPAASAGNAGAENLADLTVTRLPLVPLRPVRRLRGSLAELLTGSSNDYVYAELREALPVPDAFARLQQRYPWLLLVERLPPAGLEAFGDSADTARRRQAIARGDLELVLTFLEDMTGSPASAEWRNIVRSTLEELRLADRQADSPVEVQ